MNNKVLPPNLRFKPFNSDWQEFNLGDLATIKTGALDANAAKENGEYAFFTCGKETLKTDSYNFEGDSIIVSGNGDIGFTRKYSGKFNAYQRTYVLQNFSIDFNYLEQAIHRYLPDRIKSESFGGAMPYIKLNTLSELKIPAPASVEYEVRSIANLFDHIDKTLVLYQDKLDNLLKIKNTLLNKMFPNDTEIYPTLRFKGFDNAWKHTTINDGFDFLQNNTLSRAELNDDCGDNQNVHYGDLLVKFDEYLDVSTASLPYIQSNINIGKYKKSFLKNGDVIMADTAEDETVGKCSEINEVIEKHILSGLHTIPLRPKREYASGYLGFYMNSMSYHQQLLPLMQGIKVYSLSKSALRNTTIQFPESIEEQRLIGKLFISINKLLILYKDRISLFKKIKASLLIKMFPN